MEGIKGFLASIGISKNETEIYTALIEKGTCSVLDLAKHTNIHRSNIYDALRLLESRGFVYKIDDKTNLFSAKPLESLEHYLKQKQIELTEIIKEYKIYGRHGMKKSMNSRIKISKGEFAVREALFEMMEIGQPIYVYGIPKSASEIIGPILKDFHGERIKRKIPMYQIYNSGAEERVKHLNKMKLTEARILPKKFDSFATTNICGSKIVIFLWKSELVVMEIDDENMAEPYKNYFEILWKKSKLIK